MALKPTINGLYSQIEHTRVRSVSGKYFIRPSKVRDIFTPAKIELAVTELICDAYERVGLAKKIQQEGTLVFAILVWMRWADYIVIFRNHDCLDNKLPIPEARAQEIAPEFGLSFAQEYQWQFLPYVFRQDMSDHHCQIDDLGMIFPFVGEPEHIADGGYGEVSKLTILTSLQEFFMSTDDTVTVIRKRVKRRKSQSLTRYHDAFAKEMATLTLLHRLSHPNIVPLLGSYTYDNEHNFLFPPFEMDLNQFFKQEARFGEFRWDFTFPLALCGLASALEHTHNLHLDADKNGLDFDAIGYHHDFRPANILVSKSTYVLTDFGLGKLKPAEDNSETPWRVGAGDYIAPECMDASFAHQQVGRAIDVWAFGCLVAEVVTYMERGPEGLQLFRQSRLGEMHLGFKSTYFYGKDGQLKTSVRHWLEELGNTSSSSTQRLLQIAFQSLEPQAEARPCISQVRRDLAAYSLRVLFSAVLGNFTRYLNDITAEEQNPIIMQLWFEGERLRAFGEALSLDFGNELQIFGDFEKYKECCGIMISLFHLIQSELDSRASESPLSLQVEKRINLRGSVDERIQQLVQNLWDLIPLVYSRKVQATWLQSMQRDEVDRLNNIDTFLQSHRRKELADVGAMAHMRAIQLQILHNPTVGAAEFFHPHTDLDHLKFINGHTYAYFKKSKQVLVEWMYYRPEWTTIPQDQRLIIMELRAKDFNTDPKPRGLRILKCLGFVEQSEGNSRKQGYGFIYELPAGFKDNKFTAPVTLRQLLLQGVDHEKGPSSQAPLRGKLQIAHSLALFFEEFYTVGCLHETFNSNNVIFTYSIPEILSSTNLWSEPYVVGFQKCRPDGQTWATEGPSDDMSLRDYEHPEYRVKGRYLLEYDYYSLGLVLLEIGLWCPLQMWSDRKEYRNMAPKEFRNLLVAKYVPRLTATVGEIYRDAVRTCLDGTLDRDREGSSAVDVNGEVFNIFAVRVAKPLEELSLLRI
ncbi:kinase-like protein [Lepidopterella palustris CBS 459.81]|uniref:Kinase-like protein n=1 Tax=Lepidopterella palustris CBS 459.81 TaxID=1314670 RepID=A0A8E2E2T1_9PEZI|nr:kinase-like protein [Lepidopterella palustris CBS 459.81]